MTSPATILRAYHQECFLRGKRGAFKRAGDCLGCSDEWIRRTVRADEQARQAVLEQLIMSPFPLLEHANCQLRQLPTEPVERETAPFVALVPHDFVADGHNAADAAVLVMWALFGLELAAAARHVVLALLLLVPLLLWCHVAAVMGRDWRRLKGSGEG